MKNPKSSRITTMLGVILAALILAGCANEQRTWRGEATAFDDSPVPVMSPGGDYVLGVLDGTLGLFKFPDWIWIDAIGPDSEFRSIAWAPDGEEYAYRVEVGENDHIYLGKPGDAWQVGTTANALSGDTKLIWSPDGRYLMWDQPLSILDRITGEVLAPEMDRYDFIRSPLFSPDSNRLFFTRFGEDGSDNLWQLELTNGTLHQVTDADDGDYPLHWLDDGGLLVQVGKVSTGGGSVYGMGVVDVSTGEREIVIQAGQWRNVYATAVSPGGTNALGRWVRNDQPESQVVLIKLGDYSRYPVLDNHFLWQAHWLDDNQVLISAVVPWDGAYEDREYRVYHFRVDGEPEMLAAEKDYLYILGVQDNVLHYLEQEHMEQGSVWHLRTVEF